MQVRFFSFVQKIKGGPVPVQFQDAITGCTAAIHLVNDGSENADKNNGSNGIILIPQGKCEKELGKTLGYSAEKIIFWAKSKKWTLRLTSKK